MLFHGFSWFSMVFDQPGTNETSLRPFVKNLLGVWGYFDLPQPPQGYLGGTSRSFIFLNSITYKDDRKMIKPSKNEKKNKSNKRADHLFLPPQRPIFFYPSSWVGSPIAWKNAVLGSAVEHAEHAWSVTQLICIEPLRTQKQMHLFFVTFWHAQHAPETLVI